MPLIIFHVIHTSTYHQYLFLCHIREIEGKVYKALVKEKEKAQDEYDKAVSLGQTAAQVSSRYVKSNIIFMIDFFVYVGEK